MHSYCIYCDGDGDSEDGDGGDDGVLFWGSHYGNAVTTMGVQVVCLMSNKEKKTCWKRDGDDAVDGARPRGWKRSLCTRYSVPVKKRPHARDLGHSATFLALQNSSGETSRNAGRRNSELKRVDPSSP